MKYIGPKYIHTLKSKLNFIWDKQKFKWTVSCYYLPKTYFFNSQMKFSFNLKFDENTFYGYVYLY